MKELNKFTKMNIVNFLQWNDKHSTVTEQWNDMALLSILIFELFGDYLEKDSWHEVMKEYQSCEEILQDLNEVAPDILEFFNVPRFTSETDYQKLIQVDFGSRI